MYHLYICVYFPHNDQLGCTHFSHNALSPQCIVGTYVCIFPTTPTRTHRFSPQCTSPQCVHLYICVYFPHNDKLGCTHFPHNTFSPQCTFPTMYCLYICVYFPDNDQLGRTHFPHNALSPQYIIYTYVCIFPTTTNENARIFPTMFKI